MPSTVYTVVLWEVANAIGTPTLVGPSPPPGFAWVIRDCSFRFPVTSGFYPHVSQAVLSVNGFPVAETPGYRSIGSVTYRVAEVRQAVGVADLMEFDSALTGWNFRVTGYQLTAT